MLKKLRHELNYLTAEDVGGVFLFVFSLIPAMFFRLLVKLRKREIWVICEDKNEARDNGFCFFEYMCREHPEIECVYALSRKSPDLEKVRAVGKVIPFGGFRHWIYYWGAEYNVSSQKAGGPNKAVCYVLEVFGLKKSNSVFLQHGITKNDAKWLYYSETKMRLFICGAKPETDFVKEKFGYPEGHVAYTGFARFDDYHGAATDEKKVLLMPSWREWIASKNEFSDVYEDTSDFTKTEYFEKYEELINSPRLCKILEERDLTLCFYPHRNMQKYLRFFSAGSDRIKILSNRNSDIRELLMTSAVMITDYSSVALDFAYMKKPVVYYKFDEERFREAQYAEGYLDDRTAGLGKVCESADGVCDLLEEIYDRGVGNVTEEFAAAHKAFFPLFDADNSKRIYEAIKALDRRSSTARK